MVYIIVKKWYIP